LVPLLAVTTWQSRLRESVSVTVDSPEKQRVGING
jgi:hypothetical protein